MLATEFVEPFRREMPPSTLHKGRLSCLLRPVRSRSHQMGEELHDFLSHGSAEIEQSPLDYVIDYTTWCHRTVIPIERQLETGDSYLPLKDEAYAAFNELNFNRISKIMVGIWADGMAGSPPSRKQLGMTQDLVAIEGLRLFDERDYLASESTNYSYFDPTFRKRRMTLEGIINELDAAILLMEIAKRNPGMNVLSAPPQFGRDTASLNSDFIVTYKESAIGVQVKSRVRDEDYCRYNPDRVVLIDGVVDMGNEAARRVSAWESKLPVVTWGGMLCAARASQIPFEAQASLGLPLQDMMHYRLLSKRLLGKTKSVLPQATQRVEPRIMAKLT